MSKNFIKIGTNFISPYGTICTVVNYDDVTGLYLYEDSDQSIHYIGERDIINGAIL